MTGVNSGAWQTGDHPRPRDAASGCAGPGDANREAQRTAARPLLLTPSPANEQRRVPPRRRRGASPRGGYPASVASTVISALPPSSRREIGQPLPAPCAAASKAAASIPGTRPVTVSAERVTVGASSTL